MWVRREPVVFVGALSGKGLTPYHKKSDETIDRSKVYSSSFRDNCVIAECLAVIPVVSSESV